MKAIKLIFSLIIFILFNSCTEVNNPDLSMYDDMYIGGPGTKRTYTEITKMWNLEKNQPWYMIPDNLKSKIPLSDEQLQQGIVYIYEHSESVKLFDEYLYSLSNFTLPREKYKIIEDEQIIYSLPSELDAISHGQSYTKSNLIHKSYYEINTEFSYYLYLPQLLKFPVFKNDLHIGDTWIRESYIDTSSNDVSYKIITKVIGFEYVQVPAGSFAAYKLQNSFLKLDRIGNVIFESLLPFEYYSPLVGLVLAEYESTDDFTSNLLNPGDHARHTYRKELTSYDFVAR